MKITNPFKITFLALCCIVASPVASATNFALVNCNVFNGTDNRIDEKTVVIVEGKNIQQIGKSEKVKAEGMELIDCEGNYLMPGLIDVHTHLNNMEAAHRALVAGPLPCAAPVSKHLRISACASWSGLENCPVPMLWLPVFT